MANSLTENKQNINNNCHRASQSQGVLNKVSYGESPSRCLTINSFIYRFCQKRYPFRIPFVINKWYPFHVACLELCIPFNYCYCTVFNIQLNHKNQNVFSTYFTVLKCVLAFLGLFTDRNDRFSYPFISYSN